jgi:hypothetical protein
MRNPTVSGPDITDSSHFLALRFKGAFWLTA